MSRDTSQPDRRDFLKSATALPAARVAGRVSPAREPAQKIVYPRPFTARQLSQIAFPLGGVCAGSVSLGGRGQLRDWEIFNKPDKGRSLTYALPSIWVDDGQKKVAHVLEARYEPPYQGENGLGSRNAPGLSRLASARFEGEYPFARVHFEDRSLPVSVSLEAFSPFIPHEEDDSGLPVAILRYRVTNHLSRSAQVSIAYSIENPVLPEGRPPDGHQKETRTNEFRVASNLRGLYMTNAALTADHPMGGSFVLGTLSSGDAKLTHLTGWPKGRWWNSPLLFWDDFSADGALGPETGERDPVGALCLSQTIAPGAASDFTYLLAWHFPNRTPRRCGWVAPKGDEDVRIGNWYCERWKDAWDAATYAAENLPRLETRTRSFAGLLHGSTLPDAVKDAVSANLSTLATTTCFRTADGEFHGFEGSNDTIGCCHGNCTHVWNYETTTAYLFPRFARSLRRAAFGFSMDDAGAMHFRQALPDGKERSGFAAADGQMGQIVHAYLDWKLSGDRAFLSELWPRVQKAIAFSWVRGGWDADRDGVLEGVQHNTYDVEFYGPNPQCGIYYLAALRAAEEMARAMGDERSAADYHELFRKGSTWIDAHLFNGEYYVQQVRGRRGGEIAPALRSDMGSEDTEHPQYQVGEGCLVDQLIGQYMADVCGLGPLLNPKNIRTTLASIYRYNYKPTLIAHENVQRTFALNDEAALIVCDYAKSQRPAIPFPYFAELFTGMEYSTASQMLFAGLTKEGLQCIESVRARYDGERRNPYDEAECGHHYARAMSAWSALLALSGFAYHAADEHLSVHPRGERENQRCFWSTGQGWGSYRWTQTAQQASLSLQVVSGMLSVTRCDWTAAPGATHRASLSGKALDHKADGRDPRITEFHFPQPVVVKAGGELSLMVAA